MGVSKNFRRLSTFAFGSEEETFLQMKRDIEANRDLCGSLEHSAVLRALRLYNREGYRDAHTRSVRKPRTRDQRFGPQFDGVLTNGTDHVVVESDYLTAGLTGRAQKIMEKIRNQRRRGASIRGLVWVTLGMSAAALRYAERSCKRLSMDLHVCVYTPRRWSDGQTIDYPYGTRLIGSHWE